MARYVDLDKVDWLQDGQNGNFAHESRIINTAGIEDVVGKSNLETLRNNLIQDIQNGVIKISSGNERLFNRIDEMIELCSIGPSNATQSVPIGIERD